MGASGNGDTNLEGWTPLNIRITPSFKRRLLRVAKLTDAGTLQSLVMEALTRDLEEREARLLPLLAAIKSQYDTDGPAGDQMRE